MPALKNMTQDDLKSRQKERNKERNRRNNERLKEARESLYKNNPAKLIKCSNCGNTKKVIEFYKSGIHVKFKDQKPVGFETGECKHCVKIKQKERDKLKTKRKEN